jgi:hypothetical protein
MFVGMPPSPIASFVCIETFERCVGQVMIIVETSNRCIEELVSHHRGHRENPGAFEEYSAVHRTGNAGIEDIDAPP